MTIVTTLSPSMDLSNSYLFLKTKGEISTIFTIDALAKASFDSKEFPLATLPLPGASFVIPQLLSGGPKFVLNAQAIGEVQLAGHFETKVDIANWDMQQTYPDANGDFDPKSLSKPQRDFDLQGLKKPTWNASVKAQGHLTAYLKPTLSFGIEFDSRWKIGKCTAELVASGYVRVRAEAGTDDSTCPFKYAIDAGSLLTARATAPDQFNWKPQSFDFFPIDSNLIPGDGSNWVCVDGSSSTPNAVSSRAVYSLVDAEDKNNVSVSLQKRGPTYGPFFHIPGIGELCFTSVGEAADTTCNNITGYDQEQLDDPNFDGTLRKRSADKDDLRYNATLSGEYHWLEERDGGTETYDFCIGDAKMSYKTPAYPSGTVTYDCANWGSCDNYNFDVHGPDASHKYIDEHILEVRLLCFTTWRHFTEQFLQRQMIQQFAHQYIEGKSDPNGQYASYCKYVQFFWFGQRGRVNGVRSWDLVASVYPSSLANGHEIVRIEAEVNQAKARVSAQPQSWPCRR